MIDTVLMQDHIRRANPIGHIDDIDPDELAAFVTLTRARKAGTIETPVHHGTRATPSATPPRRRSRAAAFAVAFILIAAIVGVAALALRGDTVPAVDEPVPPTTIHPPTTLGEPQPAPVDINSLRWSRVPLDAASFGREGDAISSVTIGGPGLVAVGEMGGKAAVWTSSDGYSWSRVPHDESVLGGPDNSRIDSVTSGGPGLVAGGASGFLYPDPSEYPDLSEDGEVDPAVLDEFANDIREGVATVWLSADGATWSRVLLHEIPNRMTETGPGAMEYIIAGGPGLIAIAEEASVFSSDDGITWEPIHQAKGMLSVVDGGPGLVGVGGWLDGVSGFTFNGVTWSRSPIPVDTAYGGGFGVQIRHLTVGGPGFVAVGHGFFDPTPEDEEPDWAWAAAVWTSRDGYTWSAVPFDRAVFTDSTMDKVIATDTGLLAVGFVGEIIGERAGLWTSPDGITWSRVPDDGTFGEGTRIDDIAVGGPGIVAVGAVNDAPAIWVATAEGVAP